MKYWLLSWVLLCCVPAYGQGKWDANWCFGIKAGINFKDTADVKVFPTQIYLGQEANASISDSAGNLLFYLAVDTVISKNDGLFYNVITSVRTGQTSDSIRLYLSVTNGALILPMPGSKNRYIIYHIGYTDYDYTVCTQTQAFCYSLFYSIVNFDMDATGRVIFEETNHLVLRHVSERMAAVKHANGKDWWVLVHQLTDTTVNTTTPPNCADTYCKILLTEALWNMPITYQKIGTPDCNSIFGEMTFNQRGDKLVSGFVTHPGLNYFDFDRCTGELTNLQIIDNETAYSCEFSASGKYLYVATNVRANLYQYDLEASNIAATKFLVASVPLRPVKTGQLQLAPDNKIYFGYTSSIGGGDPEDHFLSMIVNPDSSASSCDFRPFSFFLGNDVWNGAGLPSFPNYNLPPFQIYQADAGRDTFWCVNDSSLKGVYIGCNIPIPGLLYEWQAGQGIDSIYRAQQLVSPPQSRWYYLTITDTTIQGNCQSRTDSVYVEVRVCTGVEEEEQSESNVKVYPNPANEQLIMEAPSDSQFLLYDILGRLAVRQTLQAPKCVIDITTLPEGLYIYRVGSNAGKVQIVR